jgi:hypothetical protein
MIRLPRSGDYFVQKLLELGRQVRGAVLAARGESRGLAGVSRETGADTIYQIDAHVEPILVDFCEKWGRELPLVMIAEGLGEGEGSAEGKMVFPQGTPEAEARVRIICDPIDGTRGIMYDKRAAWFLAGVAPNRGDRTRLSDIDAAVQVEIPTSKQSRMDLLWAVRGGGAFAVREEMKGTTVEKQWPLPLAPSGAENIDHGFASISNFFPGTKELASRLMERIVESALASGGSLDLSRGMVFEDQYISTGGQLYELIVGHDRFNADLRPLFYRMRGLPVGLCVHPYDVASLLVATEAGVVVTDGLGKPLEGPLDVTTPLHWAGFANAALQARIEPVLTETLHSWLAGGV